MGKSLRILIVEDSELDLEMALAELHRAGFDPQWKRVETEADFLAELKHRPDIILSDYHLPQFSGLRAVQLLKASGLDVPFILMSGTIGEDVAVQAMKHGAADYLLKDRISRLGSAIHGALEQKLLRDERAQLGTSLTLFRALVDRASDGIDVVDPETGRFLDVNETSCARLGYTREELLSMTVADIETHNAAFTSWPAMVQEIRHAGSLTVEGRQKRKDGSTFPVEINVRLIKLDREYLIASVRDITERKQAEELSRENERKFSTLFQASPVAMALSTINEGRYLDANHEFLRMMQGSREDVIGRTSVEMGVWSGPEERAACIARFKEQGVIRDVELQIKGRAGLVTHILWSAETVTVGGKSCLLGTFQDITERKRAEELSRENERKFSTLFQASPVAMALSTIKEGRYLDVNHEFLRLLQCSREDVIGHTSLELGIWSNREERTAHMARLSEHGVVRDVDLQIKGRAGLVTNILWSAETVTVGGESCLLGTIQDITVRKRAEEALRESENKYRKIFENVQDVFYQTDNAGTIIEISPSIERYSGFTREELIGRPVSAVYHHPEDRDKLMKTLVEKGEVIDYQVRLKCKDGRLVYTSVNSHILTVPGKGVTGVEGALRDITARKLAEDELLQKTTFLEAQVDSALEGILVVDEQHRAVLQNDRFNEVWKFPRHVLESKDQGMKMQFAVSQTKNPKTFVEKIAYLYAHPEAVSRDEIELIDGTLLDRYSSPVRGRDGKFYGRIWAFRDITEQRKLELQFRQSQKMEAIGQLAGGVAHDFNNILAVIQLQAGLLKIQEGLSPKQREFATEIEKATQRAANLTRQLLLFSQRQAMQMRDLNLNESVTNIVKMLQRIVGEDVQMQFKLSPKPLIVHADAGMIDQIMLNLTVNSRDAMPKGGQLVIETFEVKYDEFAVSKTSPAQPGTFACLSVSDTGCGIPPEIIPRIFEPFFSTKEVGKGTGLGLATVFGIVKQHQGWVNVYSEVGLGTTMRIYLPRLDKTAAPETDRSWLRHLPKGTETILIVEDDASVRLSMRHILSHLGYRVLEATTGVGALEIWDQNRADIRLLLTDLVMPDGMNGKELAQKLLAQNANLKVVYVSGYSATVAGKDFPLEEGVNFLTKPFETHKLAQIIRKSLDGA